MYRAMLITIGWCTLLSGNAFSHILKAGFDKSEYIETLKINQKAHIQLDKWDTDTALSMPRDYIFVYRSPVVAFDNLWDLWINRSKPLAVIAIRGSVPTQSSFLANLYAAMVAAKGSLQLNGETSFSYTLAENPNAAVHVGWLAAMACLSKTVITKIDSCYQTGIKDFILTGHSQGGGITFLLTSYLYHLQKENKLPADIRFKTYCSAGPKPGNLFYAYEYESMTQGGWAYNVVNTADWVPDVPFSIQTVNDFTGTNPFRHAKAIIKQQKFPKNIALRHVYNKLSNPGRRAQRNYQRYLGKMLLKMVKKQLPGYKEPEYFGSNYYVRTGNTIVLMPDSSYYMLYKNDAAHTNIWQHHFPMQYLYLAERL